MKQVMTRPVYVYSHDLRSLPRDNGAAGMFACQWFMDCVRGGTSLSVYKQNNRGGPMFNWKLLCVKVREMLREVIPVFGQGPADIVMDYLDDDCIQTPYRADCQSGSFGQCRLQCVAADFVYGRFVYSCPSGIPAEVTSMILRKRDTYVGGTTPFNIVIHDLCRDIFMRRLCHTKGIIDNMAIFHINTQALDSWDNIVAEFERVFKGFRR